LITDRTILGHIDPEHSS
jgi:hypothetical protein